MRMSQSRTIAHGTTHDAITHVSSTDTQSISVCETFRCVPPFFAIHRSKHSARRCCTVLRQHVDAICLHGVTTDSRLIDAHNRPSSSLSMRRAADFVRVPFHAPISSANPEHPQHMFHVHMCTHVSCRFVGHPVRSTEPKTGRSHRHTRTKSLCVHNNHPSRALGFFGAGAHVENKSTCCCIVSAKGRARMHSLLLSRIAPTIIPTHTCELLVFGFAIISGCALLCRCFCVCSVVFHRAFVNCVHRTHTMRSGKSRCVALRLHQFHLRAPRANLCLPAFQVECAAAANLDAHNAGKRVWTHFHPTCW